MYRLKVKRDFAASHRLPDHPGKCANMHGHTWEVEAEVSAKNVGVGGMVIDFADVKTELEEAIEDLDHSVLNELKPFQIVPPTAENVATLILGRMRAKIDGVTAVTVWESKRSSVTVEQTSP